MFVLTEIIDCILLMFSKILSLVLAQNGVFPEIALQYSLDGADAF
jgi:hypothetical protein